MKNIFIPLKQSPDDDGSGGGGGNNSNTPDPKDKAPTEAEKERDRLLTENADLRKKQKEVDTSLQTLREELNGLKKAGHKGAGDWQKVAESLETELASFKDKNAKLSSAFKNTLVSGKLREEALKNGAKSDMVDLIDSMDFEEIEFHLDEDNLKFNIKGVDTALSNLKRMRPSFFGAAEVPKFNAGGAGGNSGTPKKLDELKAEYISKMKTRHKDPVGFSTALKNYQDGITAAKAKK